MGSVEKRGEGACVGLRLFFCFALARSPVLETVLSFVYWSSLFTLSDARPCLCASLVIREKKKRQTENERERERDTDNDLIFSFFSFVSFTKKFVFSLFLFFSRHVPAENIRRSSSFIPSSRSAQNPMSRSCGRSIPTHSSLVTAAAAPPPSSAPAPRKNPGCSRPGGARSEWRRRRRRRRRPRRGSPRARGR